MATPTATANPERHRLAWWALLVFTCIVGAVTFVLSFAGLEDYGRRVAGLGDLSPLVPIGVDGLTLCAVAATFIARDRRFSVRLYAWFVFAVAVACSVAGNLSHAAAKALSWQGSIGAAAWPILLALASHLVVVVRRQMERHQTAATPPAPAAADPLPAGPVPAPPAAATPRPAPPPTPAPAPRRTPPHNRPVSGRADNDITRQRARDMYRRGRTDLAGVASELGVSKRSVERYTADLRQGPVATADDDQERALAGVGA